MLLIIAWVVWIGIWGGLGYISFKTIMSRIEQKRMANSMVSYWEKQAELQRNYNRVMYNATNPERKDI